MPKINPKREIILQASGARILITPYEIKKKIGMETLLRNK